MPPGSAATWTVVRAGLGSREVGRVDAVHRVEVVDVGEEAAAAHDVVEAGAGRGEDAPDVLEREARLFLGRRPARSAPSTSGPWPET